MLAWSKREKAFKDFRAGIITQKTLDDVKNLFDEADREGRIDYTK
jgi:hypothetical protein